MRIDVILPFKEIFSKDKASAVSLTVKNSTEYSEFKNKINVFGQYTDNPFKNIKFNGIKVKRFFHFGNNRSILINYLHLSKKRILEKKIIEIHNRPYLFNIAIKKRIKDPITLHFHNDPCVMKGSKSIKERIFIANNAAAVYFVSQYIKSCFLEGLNQNFKNLFVLPNAIQRRIVKLPKKKKQIMFIGRLVPEKGCHLFVEAISEIVKNFPEWQFSIIGTPKAGENKLNLLYAKNLIKNFKSLGKNVEYFGFISNENVIKKLEKVSILIVPSIWQEPFALTALEGICSGTAVIASKVGGMSEMLENTGFLISNINAIKLREAIKSLLLDQNLLLEYQNKSWKNYRYNQTDIVKRQDIYRKEIMYKYNISY